MDDKINIRQKKIVDSREPSIIRDKLLEIGWYQQQLISADYSFLTCDYKKVGIERKAVGDFVSSLSERLIKQLYNMLDYYDFPILLLEGSWKMLEGQLVTNRGIELWGWSLVWNFIRTWQHRGITIEMTANEGHTVKRLNELFVYYQKPSHTGGVTHRIVGDKRLLAFPEGVGIKTAEKILTKMGSLKAVANASYEQLIMCEDVGRKRAETIVAFYNKTRSKNHE